jgi:uncharacterized protein (TIGR00251 family)
LRITVRVTPKSHRDAVGGIEDTAEGPAIKVRVRAVPEDGAANAALARLFADWLGVPKGTIEVVAGTKSRVKTIFVTGEKGELASLMAARLSRPH